MARLKSSLWIQAHMRRCEIEGAFAVIVRKGDEDAGAIAIKIYGGQNQARLILQSMDLDGNSIWRDVLLNPASSLDPNNDLNNILEQKSTLEEKSMFVSETKVDERLAREINMDPDLWVIEIENCNGHGFLEIASQD